MEIINTGKHSTDLVQGELEVPCLLTFVGESQELLKMRKLKSTVPTLLALAVEPSRNWAKIDLCSLKDDIDLPEKIDAGCRNLMEFA